MKTVPLSHRRISSALGGVILVALFLDIFSLFPAPIPALAQTTIRSPWTSFNLNDGLAANNVWSILVEGNTIWFGTDAGISRFDGTWRSYKSDQKMNLDQVRVLAGAADQGAIWAGTATGKVSRWDGQQWVEVCTAPGSIQALQDVDGELWIGTDRGLYTWNGAALSPIEEIAGMAVSALFNRNDTVWVGTMTGLRIKRGETWDTVTTQEGLPSDEITAIWVEPNGTTWIGTTSGIAWQDPATGQWTVDSTHPYRIQALTGDGRGTVWAGTVGNGALKIVDYGALIIAYAGDLDLSTRFVQAVALDAAGSVWFGTAVGVFRYDDSIWINEEGDAFVHPGVNNINALLATDDGTLWIGTSGAGVRRKQGIKGIWADNDTSFTTQNSVLSSDIILSLVQDSQDGIWAGTPEGVTRFANGQWEVPAPMTELPSATVNALAAQSDNVWIGTDAGLARYNMVDHTLTVDPFVHQFMVKALAVDFLGRLWVGTSRNGVLIHQEGDHWTQIQHDPQSDNGLAGDSIVSLAPDPDSPGGMWVAVDEKGVSHWNGQEWTNYTSASGLPSNLVYTVYSDPVTGDLWIGSEGGATRYDGLTWETYSGPNNLQNTVVYAVYRAPNGGYWFGGRDGLTYYHPEHLLPWVRIDSISGPVGQFDGTSARVEINQPVTIHLAAGDLHTDTNDLKILYRVTGPGQPGQWQESNDQTVYLPAYLDAGTYTVEAQVRDQSFNYSVPVRLALILFVPPATVDVPGLGTMRSGYLATLVIVIIAGLAGFSYMSLEIIQSWRRSREAVVRGYNPYISGEPVRREDMFFGRHALLQRIVDTLHNNSIMIHGERRIGKTTLLYQLANRLREINDPEFWFVPLYIDLEGTTQEVFFHTLLEEILRGIYTLPEANTLLRPQLQDLLYAPQSHLAYDDREFSRDLSTVIGVLQAYGSAKHPGKQLRLILMMDEMDVVSRYDHLVQQRLRRIFMREFSATLGAVVAGVQISKEWDRVESPWYNLFNEIELEPFDRAQARELLEEPIRGYYRYDADALAFILDHSNGRPFRLQQFGLEAVNHMLANHRQHITMEDVLAAHDHIQANGTDPESEHTRKSTDISTLSDSEEGERTVQQVDL